ncbi:MAG: SUMF1/EgtB/PvdO family nonheme iron enzyme [Planctomycetota bacterium]
MGSDIDGAVARAIVELRGERPQLDCADDAMVSNSTWSNWEITGRVPPEKMGDLLAGLGVSLGAFLETVQRATLAASPDARGLSGLSAFELSGDDGLLAPLKEAGIDSARFEEIKPGTSHAKDESLIIAFTAEGGARLAKYVPKHRSKGLWFPDTERFETLDHSTPRYRMTWAGKALGGVVGLIAVSTFGFWLLDPVIADTVNPRLDSMVQIELRDLNNAVVHLLVDAHEVTNQQYSEFVEQTGHRTPKHWVDHDRDPSTADVPPEDRLDWPVVYVSHEDANAYAEWAGLRLPTLAESRMIAAYYSDEMTPTPSPAQHEELLREAVAGRMFAKLDQVSGKEHPAANAAEWTSSPWGGRGQRGFLRTVVGDLRIGQPSDHSRTLGATGVEDISAEPGLGFRCVADVN